MYREEDYGAKKYKYLQLSDRRKLADLYGNGSRIKDIAGDPKVSQNTIYNEITRGFTGRLDANWRRECDPDRARKAVMDGLRRRGPNFAAKAVKKYAARNNTAEN